MKRITFTCVVALALLGLFVSASYYSALEQYMHSMYNAALINARRAYATDLTFRHWNSRLGGVYAEITANLSPNPYLTVPDRDVQTTTGKTLTLINPAYMTRMAHEIMGETGELRGHITSLNPLRPENAPEEWERALLEGFAKDPSERHYLYTENGATMLRYMRPMMTEAYCLKCHAHQGYQVGDVRGGISITVPMAGYLEDLAAFRRAQLLRSVISFAIGAACIGLILVFVRRYEALRNRSERALRQSEARFRKLFSDAPLAMLLVNLSGTVLEVNDTAQALFRTPDDDITGSDFRQLIPVPGIDAYFAELIAERRLARECACAVQELADVQRLRLLGFAIHDGLFVVFVDDLTEMVRQHERLMAAKSEAERASKVKTEFLAVMSHEIRTPLNGVIGMLQLARTLQRSDEMDEYLSIALDSSRNLLRILSDVLDISKVESGMMQLRNAPFDFSEVIRPVMALFTEELNRKGLGFNVDIASTLSGRFVGDSGRLRQILYNLIGNAVKYSEKGAVDVALYPLPFSPVPGKRSVHIEVCDSGIGIADNKMAVIFEPFTQAEDGFSRRQGGVGLGLSIVRRLVQLMGGSLAIVSTPGEGTEVHITLQLEAVQGMKRMEETAPAPEPSRVVSLRVLVVEDDPVNRKTLLFMLNKMGHQGTGAINGREAVEMVTEGDYDVVLMDVQMPEMNGLDATRSIRALADPGKRSLPIIAITAYAMSGDREEFLAAGMDDYISKPIEMNAVRECLSRYGGNASTSAEQNHPHA